VGSFKNRLLILIVTLMALAQGVTIMLSLNYLDQFVRTDSARQLSATRLNLDQLLKDRATQLDSASRVLVADFAFREAVATGDLPTILSALTNHANRIKADMAVIYGMDGQPVATTLPGGVDSVSRFPLPEDGDADIDPVFVVMANRPFELVFAAVRAPDLIGWVALGFSLDTALAAQLSKLANTEVSFVVRNPEGTDAQIISTLSEAGGRELLSSVNSLLNTGEPVITRMNNLEYLTLSAPLEAQNGRVELVVQRSLAEAMTDFRQMRLALLLIGGAALLGAIFVAWVAGRSAVRPLGQLVEAARRVEAGDYQQGVDISGGEEFEQLAHTFSSMQLSIREREARIVQQANHDALTTLSNRAALREYLHGVISHEPNLSLVLLDVQRFRDINASLGHGIGDQLLCALAKRLTHLVGVKQQVARVGADQFAVVLCMHDSQAMHRMLTLAEELQQGLLVDGLRLNVGLHVGISEWRTPRVSVDDWLRQADVALLEAKERGPAVVTYQASHDADHRRRITLVSDLRRAIAANGLTLMFQPLVQMTDRDPVSFEVLVRWTHPTLGPISPAEFIPLAERALVIADVTRWVMRAAIAQLGQWRRQGFETEIAINLSAADITDPGLTQNLLSLLREHDVSSKQLILEVTESAIMHEPQLAAQTMQQLRMLGIRFAIDDFGTGHSSLAQLHALPVDELKIDRAFITDLERSISNTAIVQATTELGHSLGLKVVAEGVETIEVWNVLMRLGCDLVQGYLVSRPMLAEAVVEWTRAQRASQTQSRANATQDGTLSDIRSRIPA
jgi:diguanylate cyclase (GGDEF)-like protein